MDKETLVYVDLRGTPRLVGRLWARMRKDRESATFETVLRQRSLLVLGSSLQDVHVQRFIRWTTGSRRVNKTWAVLLGVNDSLRRSWGAAGVEPIDCDFASFIPVLGHHVEGCLRPSARQASG